MTGVRRWVPGRDTGRVMAGNAVAYGGWGEREEMRLVASGWLPQQVFRAGLSDAVSARGLQQQQAVGGVQGDKLAADMLLPQPAGVLLLPGDANPGINGHHALVGMGQVNGDQTRTRRGQSFMRMQHHAAGGNVAQVADHLVAGVVVYFGQRDEAGAP